MRPALLVSVLVLSLLSARAQEPQADTVLQLKGVTITSQRIGKFAIGQVVQSLDTSTRIENPAGSLSELIPGFTSAYVRNYGQGTLTTISVRGSSANHTGLHWNGLRLSPPNIGYVDLSLVQGDFFQEVLLLYGGASPMFGSSAIGGGIHLNNRPVFDSLGWESKIGLSAGSFTNLMTNGNVNFISKKWYSHTAFSLSGAENDFQYENLSGENARMEHAGFFKTGFLQDLAVRLPKDQYLMASCWFQYADRNIPPTLTESSSAAGQIDRSWRSMLVWKDFNVRNSLEAKAAWFNEYTSYSDPNLGIYSLIQTQTIASAFESNWNVFKATSLFAGLNYTFEYADLDYYQSSKNQHNIALIASGMQNLPGTTWKFSMNARQEFQTGYKVPFLYSFGAEGKIWRPLSGRFSFSRNFRAPTFNERFWQPGGNPDLSPEDSYNCEAGITIDPGWLKAPFEFYLTGFSSWVSNWILWLPGNGGLWTVTNAQDVWSRGVEISTNQTIPFRAMIFYYSFTYTMSFSTNQKKLFESDQSYHKQLIYTPVHRFLAKAGTEWKGFRLTLKGSYNGLIYTTKDNSAYLPAWFLFDAIISKSILVRGRSPVSLQINFNNIADINYEVIPYRPMPGFNLMATVVIGFIGR